MTGKILKRFKYYLGKNHPLSDAVLQWISYVVCTFHIVYLSRALLWGLLYFVCCLSLFILSSFDYLVLVDFFIYLMSFLSSWIVVGRLIFCMSLKLLPKPRWWVLIIAVMVHLYFIDFKLIDFKLIDYQPLYVILV